MMNDLISRPDVIDSFRMDDDGTAWSMNDIVYRLEQFPSAQTKQIAIKEKGRIMAVRIKDMVVHPLNRDVPDNNVGNMQETRLAQELWAKVCKITDSEGLQHEVIHYGDLKDIIREVCGWMIS